MTVAARRVLLLALGSCSALALASLPLWWAGNSGWLPSLVSDLSFVLPVALALLVSILFIVLGPRSLRIAGSLWLTLALFYAVDALVVTTGDGQASTDTSWGLTYFVLSYFALPVAVFLIGAIGLAFAIRELSPESELSLEASACRTKVSS